MKKLFFVSAAILLLAAGCGSSQTSAPQNQQPQSQAPEMQQTAQQTPPAQSAPGQATVNPISTNTGAVAGVDLSEFANQANQSGASASQDGTTDAKAMSSDGATINSQTDSVSNPIQ